MTVTETSGGAGSPRVVMKEVPIVKPIVVSVAEAKLQQQMADIPLLEEIQPVTPAAAPAEDEMAAIRAAVERRKQLLAETSPGSAVNPAPAPAPAAATKICPSCGQELPERAKFCNKCGNKF